MEQLGSHWKDFNKIWNLSLFSENMSINFKFLWLAIRIRDTLHEDVFRYLAKLFLEWETFQIKVVDKIKIHISCFVTFSRNACRLWDNVEKCGGDSGCRQYGACALHAWLVRLHTSVAAPVHQRPHPTTRTHTNALTHVRARAHTEK